MHIAAALAALGIGFGAGVWTPNESSDTRGVGEGGGGTAITFEGGQPAVPDSSKSSQPSLGLISFQQFSDARERLAELLDALDRRRFLDTLEWERLLDEVEQILSLASEAELVEFLTGRDFTRQTVSLAEIGYGALARISPERAAEVWRSEHDETIAHPALKVVMREWVKRDAAAAERWVDGFESEEGQRVPKAIFLTIRSKLHPEMVVASLDDERILSSDAALLLGESLALEKMGEMADRFLVTRNDGSSLSESLPYFLSTWGSRDPLAAATWFLSTDLRDFDEQEVTTALGMAVTKDPSGVLQLLSPELSTHPQLRKVARQAWWAWISEEGNEVAGIEWIGQHAEAAAQFGRPDILGYNPNAAEWTSDRVDRALAALKNVTPSESVDRFAQLFIAQLSSFQPKIALNYATTFLPPGSESDRIIAGAVANWAAIEPEVALQWSFENIEGEQARLSAIKSSVTRWAQKDPGAAATFSMGLEENERRWALSGLGESWAQIDAEAAIAFLASSTEPDNMAPMADRAFRHFGQSRSGDVFFERAMDLPEGKLRTAALRGLFGGWGYRDAAAASAMISQVPEGEMRDATIFAFNQSTAHHDPQTAIKLAAQISIPERRDRETIWHGREWMKKSPAEAEAAIRANPAISDSVKAEIFKRRTE
jgi:hypothetical protein